MIALCASGVKPETANEEPLNPETPKHVSFQTLYPSKTATVAPIFS